MILQFGAGNFLRGFVDLFAAQLNRNPSTRVGPVVVVQSTGSGRAEALNRAEGKYHVAIQGFVDGKVIDEVEYVDSILRALSADSQWDEVLATALDPDLKMVVSNTTEAGLALDAADTVNEGTPRSFPAKLLSLLLARHSAALDPLVIVPCELVERNGERLRDLVMQQADRWQVGRDAADWIREECVWINNLVDRIVPGPPRSHSLLEKDPLLLATEPFALWALETPNGFAFTNPEVRTTADLSPYYLRKVRILNGLHSALASHARPLGIATVGECVDHPKIGPWLQDLLFREIVPAIEGRAEEAAGFAMATLDRFRNPFLKHELSSIALNHKAKVEVRLLPTYEEYRRLFEKEPVILGKLLRGEGLI